MRAPPAGWYHAEGDQAEAVRYWDGSTWAFGPVAAPGTSTPATAAPTPLAPGWRAAVGDPVGTLRYWDGTQWIGGPLPYAAGSRPVRPSRPLITGLFSFEGRINRTTYLVTQISLFAAFLVAGVVDGIAGTFDAELGFGVFGGLLLFVWIWPGIATNAKRFHDQNLSGWWSLLGLIPLVGLIVYLVLLFRPGTVGPNNYGEPAAPGVAL